MGNPVRAAIAALRGTHYDPPAPDGPFRLLVTGGSQGARVFAEVVPAAIAALPQVLRGQIEVSQQCRPEDLSGVERAYAETGIEARLAPFFDDMPARLGEAHLVICRAGASTIAELAAAGRPAILVPLPIAADDHQSANGRALVAAGAATMIKQVSLTPARLAQELETLMAEPAQLAQQAAAAAGFARPDAARALADLVEGLIGTQVPEPAAEGVGGAA